VNCDDGNPCTVDECDAFSGQCTHVCDPLVTGGETCPDAATTPMLTLLDSLAEMDKALGSTLTGSCARLEVDVPTPLGCSPDMQATSTALLYDSAGLISTGNITLTVHSTQGTADLVVQLTEASRRSTLSQTVRVENGLLRLWGTLQVDRGLVGKTERTGGWVYSAGGGPQEDPNSAPGFHDDAAAMFHCASAVAAFSLQGVVYQFTNAIQMLIDYILNQWIPYTPPTSCTGPSIRDAPGQSCAGVNIPCKNDLPDMCLSIGDLPGVSNAFKKCMKGRCGCGGSRHKRTFITCDDEKSCGACGVPPSGIIYYGCSLLGQQLWYCDPSGVRCDCIESVSHEMSHACGAYDGQGVGNYDAYRIGDWFRDEFKVKHPDSPCGIRE
jgi:hypothetical protein